MASHAATPTIIKGRGVVEGECWPLFPLYFFWRIVQFWVSAPTGSTEGIAFDGRD